MNTGGKGQERILIAGAGPAGSSLAVRLAQRGKRVVIIERSVFPRHKLCGEFISPECLSHFSDLGVLSEMDSAGGDRICETVFYSMRGRSAVVPSKWFKGAAGSALGLSRAEMDKRLLDAAKKEGAEVIEGASVTGVEMSEGRVTAVEVRFADGQKRSLAADIFVDATGRQRVLSKQVSDSDRSFGHKGPKLVGFKAHLSGSGLAPGRCEIYFFPGGYGGLNYVEDGWANHCFLIRAEKVREFGGDADDMVESLVLRNARARETLSGVKKRFEWLAVSVDAFGAFDPAPAGNVFAVGDAAAFIDPFTGSGMLMALESSGLLSEVMAHTESGLCQSTYRKAHGERFRSRLRFCSLMRRFAFDPRVASAAVSLVSVSGSFRKLIASRTRNAATDASGR